MHKPYQPLPWIFLFGLCCCFFLMGCYPHQEYRESKLTFHKEVAKIHLAEGRFQDALKELQRGMGEKSCDLESQLFYKCDPEVYNLMGVIYLNLKDWKKAEESLSRALKIDPNFSEAYNNLGLLFLLQGKYQTAISYFEKAIANPLYTNAHSAKTNMAQAYYLLGDKEKALEILIGLLREKSDYPDALLKLGEIYLNERDLNSAEFYFKQALKLDRNLAEARYYLGEVFLLQGRTELAREIWESLLLTQPNSPWSNKARERIFFLERIKQSKGNKP